MDTNTLVTIFRVYNYQIKLWCMEQDDDTDPDIEYDLWEAEW